MGRFAPAQLAVIGLGYIGLPTAAFFAEAGFEVTGVDIDEHRVEGINRGEAPFYEPGFDDMLKAVVSNGSLRASTSVPVSDVFIIAVPTPLSPLRDLDNSLITEAVEAISKVLRPGDLVILESTSPPGTTRAIASHLEGLRPDLTTQADHEGCVYLCYCPERVLPGAILTEMARNDRVVGGTSPEAATMARDLYSTFVTGQVLVTDDITAEMVKLTENAFRDVNIAFANELSMIASEHGVDVWELIELANRHPRVDILSPGPGVGGHCIAVDPWFLASGSKSARLIQTARQVNDDKPYFVISQINHEIELSNAKDVAILGLAFKPNVSDLRESPALLIAQKLAETWLDVDFWCVEPNIERLPNSVSDFRNLHLCELEEALQTSPVVALLVDHREFIETDRDLLSGRSVIDTRGVWKA